MSIIDATLRPGERDELLAEVAEELPVWIARSATPVDDPVLELVDLLRFDADDLRRVQAVHLCADPVVQRFIATLPAALRAPVPTTERPLDVAAAVRGPIDWPTTTQLHAAGRAGMYATRPRRRTFDSPEHRALAWVLRALAGIASRAGVAPSDDAEEPEADSVAGHIAAIRRGLSRADRVEWLRDIPKERPTGHTRQRLAQSRNGWVRGTLAPAVELLAASRTTDTDALVRLLRERYFVPDRDWRLHEIVVLIRLDRALTAASHDQLRRRLLSDNGIVAEYRLADGSRVRLRQQTWAAGGAVNRRQQTAKRHGFSVGPSKPDIIIERDGTALDRAVLELKASREAGTLGGGLSQLLGYLHEYPSLFDRLPSGWLVPLPWEQLKDVPPDPFRELWVVPADRVAAAVVERFCS